MVTCHAYTVNVEEQHSFSRYSQKETSEMAILAIFTGKGVTSDMYDALKAEVDWVHQQPQGAISHTASFDEAGDAHVADVWASPEALDHFVNTRLAPAMQRLNIPLPDVTVYPVHNIDAYSGVQQFIRK